MSMDGPVTQGSIEELVKTVPLRPLHRYYKKITFSAFFSPHCTFSTYVTNKFLCQYPPKECAQCLCPTNTAHLQIPRREFIFSERSCQNFPLSVVTSRSNLQHALFFAVCLTLHSSYLSGLGAIQQPEDIWGMSGRLHLFPRIRAYLIDKS